jgi:uncharacterized protein YdeI (YjbR/CyaY-like superfamily)
MKQTFRGKVESGLVAQDLSEGRYWVAVRLPFDPHKVWPVPKPLRVRAVINGVPFRSTLFGNREDGRLLLVNRTIQSKAGATPGSQVQVEIEPDVDERSAEPPPELAKLLKSDRALKKWHSQLNYSIRSWMASEIAKPKSPDARIRQAERIAEQMMLTMEAEQVLPPILQAAFRRQPLAQAGWDSMTPIQRRMHLLGIFHCQGPDARANRVNYMLRDALRRAGHPPERHEREDPGDFD